MKLLAMLAVAVLVALPWVAGSYFVTVLIFIFFYAYLGQAWNIVGGYAGQLSAGHAAFVGIGGYAAALLSAHAGLSPWIGMWIGGALAAMLGAVIGYLGFRFGLRGFYFVLLTVAFAEICRVVALNVDAVGGALGLLSILAGLLSRRVGAPMLLVFLALGMLAGEDGVLGIPYDVFTAAYLIGSVALAVILTKPRRGWGA